MCVSFSNSTIPVLHDSTFKNWMEGVGQWGIAGKIHLGSILNLLLLSYYVVSNDLVSTVHPIAGKLWSMGSNGLVRWPSLLPAELQLSPPIPVLTDGRRKLETLQMVASSSSHHQPLPSSWPHSLGHQILSVLFIQHFRQGSTAVNGAHSRCFKQEGISYVHFSADPVVGRVGTQLDLGLWLPEGHCRAGLPGTLLCVPPSGRWGIRKPPPVLGNSGTHQLLLYQELPLPRLPQSCGCSLVPYWKKNRCPLPFALATKPEQQRSLRNVVFRFPASQSRKAHWKESGLR